ncbi:zinc ABC transporter substrate-binding protein [Alsobacter sp. SYSU M60028]|uniref:Zinc ABC transporter substrate-binding protein n=1 Tax=Alsobacter ponti TaxID=2962936 RepID=A0ABT1L7E5_9HYPH|nr:zinc ABC transporter substrate-binding protein [Alsobacter ponti]MCP8936913.1 zinc ABC transporter substrate-binding protein [Alsobacter ponti]
MRRAALLLAAALGFAAPARAGDSVLAAQRPTFAIATALAKGTGLDIQAAPPALPGMARLPRALARPDPALDKLMAGATATVGIESVWPEDPLFREARARNIKVVRIDAARSLDKAGTSVALIGQPASDVPWRKAERGGGSSPYVWLSTANAIRMAAIVAADLKRLAPADAATVDANLAAFTGDMQALRAATETRLGGAPDPRVFALTDRFVYLTNELGIDVEGYFLEEDVRWTPSDLERFTQFLKDRQVRVVIHHWQPAEPIRRAVAEGGARLVVLDDGDAGAQASRPADPNAWRDALRADLDALAGALLE